MPPFRPDNDGNIDNWIFGGFSMINEGEVVVAPPLAGHRGSAWLSAPFTNCVWSSEFSLELADFAGGGSFGVWLTSHLGSAGEICGGPRHFRGLAVFGKLLVNQSLAQFLRISVSVADNEDVTKVNELVLANIPVESKTVQLRIRVSTKNGRFFIVAVNVNGTWQAMKEVEHKNAPQKWYVGVTAMNLKYFMKVGLKSVRFSKDTEFDESSGYVELSRDPHVDFPQPSSKWKSFRFEKLNEEVDRIGTPNSESNFSHLLEVMDELNAAACDLAKFREVNQFIRHKLQPYAQRWQKRAIKVVLYTYFIQDTVENALRDSKNLYSMLNQTAESLTLKSKENAAEVRQLFKEVSKQEDDEYSILVEQVADEVTARTLLYGSIVEVTLVIIFFVTVQCRKQQQQHLPHALRK